MTAEKIRQMILSITQDVIFMYQGKDYCINPHSKNYFTLGYDNDKGADDVKTYTNIKDLMTDPIYDGKCLQDIAAEVKLC